jgi:hypothetical protein
VTDTDRSDRGRAVAQQALAETGVEGTVRVVAPAERGAQVRE